MRLLVADSLPEPTLRRLRDQGVEVVAEPDLASEDLPERVPGFDVLVVRSTRVPAPVFDAADRLGLVIRAGAGTNTIDVATAAARGVYVCNVPGRNSVAVAELTMGLILALDRSIPDAVVDARAGRWDKTRYSKAAGLLGKRLAVIGLGSIGFAVAERASAFGIQVMAMDKPSRSAVARRRAADLGIELHATLDDLLAGADIVSIHVPLDETTRHLVDEGFLASCRDGAWIINTTRGAVVDEAALIRALDERGMRAGLDVFADEPAAGSGTFHSALASHPSVYATHHIGASTGQAQQAIADTVAEIVEAYRHGEVLYCVNLETRPLGTCSLVVRHLDRVGVLSEVLTLLRNAELNVEQMSNRVFVGAHAAVASIRLSGDVDDELVERLRAVPHVLGVTLSRAP